MITLNYPPPNPFVIPEDHPNREAHEWLAALINGFDWATQVDYWWIDRQREPSLAKLSEQAGPFQIAVLQAALERMHWHRQQPSPEQGLSIDYYIGSVLYGMVCALYQRKLPYAEDDVCRILSLSHHKCGHGGDVTPPFDIAVGYARSHGLNAKLLAALREFMNGLKGVGSAQVSHLKRKGGLLFVLDAESTGAGKPCWSDRFRDGLLLLTS